MNDHELVDAQVVEEHGRELVPQAPSSGTLFRTDDPVEVIERATLAANALRDVIVRKKLFKVIGQKAHVLVEGWTTLGSMLGVVPILVWSRSVTDPARGWEARVEARTLDGRLIGAAEAMCLRSEKRWEKADEYAIRSMAQTRATSKALRGPLGFVMQLAGYSATPAEEIPDGSGGPEAAS